MFNTFKVKKPQRSTFNLSHKHETSVNIGDINLMHWNWCYPGDRFKIKYSYLAKFSAMIAPNFSRMRIKSEVFYVPLSDIYPNFHDVIMNYKEESSEFVENGRKTTVNFTSFPHILLSRIAYWFSNVSRSESVPSSDDYFTRISRKTFTQEFAVSKLIHQVGVPFDLTWRLFGDGTTVNPYCNNVKYLDASSTGVTSTFCEAASVPISLFPFQAYQYVYNWYYRDSVRSPEVDIYPTAYDDSLYHGQNSFLFNDSRSTVGFTPSDTVLYNRFFNSVFQIRKRFYRKDYFNTAVSDPTVGVDSLAVPDNIVDLRKTNQLQKFIEKQALSGNRIAEFIMSHWAFKSDDYELGRPILISSSSQNVQISEVLQTSETTSDSAQGTRSGVASSYGSGNGSYFVSPDYGILLINMSVVPEFSYFGGVPRKLTFMRWEHFAFPEFAQIGMQPIYDFELGFHGAAVPGWTSRPRLEDLPVFGYAPRYSEAKMELDQVTGEMATSLRYWHQSAPFSETPNLNAQFGVIGFEDYNFPSPTGFDVYYNQIFAVTSDLLADHCQVIGLFDITVNRALPANDMPAL